MVMPPDPETDMPMFSINTDVMIKGAAKFNVNMIPRRITMTDFNSSGICDYFIAKNFDDPTIKDKLFQDLGDKFTFDRSMRQWYSTPNTQIPNDQGSFADWCYGDMKSCKEGHELACTRNMPHRLAGTQLKRHNNKYIIQ